MFYVYAWLIVISQHATFLFFPNYFEEATGQMLAIHWFCNVSGMTVMVMAPVCTFIHSVLMIPVVRYRPRFVSDHTLGPLVVLFVGIMCHLPSIVVLVNRTHPAWPWERITMYDIMTNPWFLNVRTWLRVGYVFLWGLAVTLCRLFDVPLMSGQTIFLYCGLATLFIHYIWPPAQPTTTILAFQMMVRQIVTSGLPLINIAALVLVPVVTFPTTLRELLATVPGVTAFKAFLDGEYSGENLMYLFALRRLRSLLAEHSPDAAHDMLKSILAEHVRLDAVLQVNLSDTVRNALEVSIVDMLDGARPLDMDVFTPSIGEVREMLGDAMDRFVGSAAYSDLVRRIQRHQLYEARVSLLSVAWGATRRKIRRRTRHIARLTLDSLPDAYTELQRIDREGVGRGVGSSWL